MSSTDALDFASAVLTGEVQAADPLNADRVLASVPGLNAAADVPGLVAALRAIAPGLATIDGLGIADSLAALRDLGLIMGSIRRHGPEPLDLAPELTPALLALGRRTDMVPRDTILHYTVWNPPGVRQRMYSDDEQEGYLQESVRMVWPDLHAALAALERLSFLDLHDPGFAPLLDAVADRLQPTVASMTLVARHVTPEFFAFGLRPYLEAARVDGVDYFGPAAAQLPIWLVDKALWATDHTDEDYEPFLLGLVPYSLPRWRRLHERLTGTPSIAGRLVAALGADPEATTRRSPALRAGAEAAVRALRVLVTFRGRHLGIARRVYDLDDTYTEGSGGGSVDLLRQILDLTKENARRSRPSPVVPAPRGRGQ
jgi:monodechloroaminopyrrolnitrin synthase